MLQTFLWLFSEDQIPFIIKAKTAKQAQEIIINKRIEWADWPKWETEKYKREVAKGDINPI